MGRLDGKVAVVTGASKGIGAEIARHLAAEGAAVVVNYASSKAGADTVVADITAKGGKAVAVKGDVSKKADAEGIVEAAVKNFGRLDVLGSEMDAIGSGRGGDVDAGRGEDGHARPGERALGAADDLDEPPGLSPAAAELDRGTAAPDRGGRVLGHGGV